MSYIKNKAYFTSMLQLPHGYGEVIESHLRRTQPQLGTRLSDYNKIKASINLTPSPQFIDRRQVSDTKFQIRNVSLYLQAVNSGKLAELAIPQLKPLILYYGANALFAFFVYSIFYYQNPSNHHGLDITEYNNDPVKSKLKILNRGLFARIIESYSILGMKNDFEVISYDSSSNSYQASESSRYPISTEPSLTLEELTNIRGSMRPNRMMHEFDLMDYLIIFVCSSLARYRPYLWHIILEGRKGSHFAVIEQCFHRFTRFQDRIERALIAPLAMFDPIRVLVRPEYSKYPTDNIDD
jgi:hypothetical protein